MRSTKDSTALSCRTHAVELFQAGVSIGHYEVDLELKADGYPMQKGRARYLDDQFVSLKGLTSSRWVNLQQTAWKAEGGAFKMTLDNKTVTFTI
jgi:hypothetical protein